MNDNNKQNSVIELEWTVIPSGSKPGDDVIYCPGCCADPTPTPVPPTQPTPGVNINE